MTGWRAFVAIVLGAFAGLGAFTFRYAEGFSYFSTDPRACKNCHIMNEQYAIQDRTHTLMQRSATAMVDMLDAIAAAKARGATDEQLAPALELQRKAQWRLDFVAAENSMGFHAPAEAARILGESIDFSRQAQLSAAGFSENEARETR
jgi:nitrite reductase (cytochrome c-552)